MFWYFILAGVSVICAIKEVRKFGPSVPVSAIYFDTVLLALFGVLCIDTGCYLLSVFRQFKFTINYYI
jgi:hypothetical protein